MQTSRLSSLSLSQQPLGKIRTIWLSAASLLVIRFRYGTNYWTCDMDWTEWMNAWPLSVCGACFLYFSVMSESRPSLLCWTAAPGLAFSLLYMPFPIKLAAFYLSSEEPRDQKREIHRSSPTRYNESPNKKQSILSDSFPMEPIPIDFHEKTYFFHVKLNPSNSYGRDYSHLSTSLHRRLSCPSLK